MAWKLLFPNQKNHLMSNHQKLVETIMSSSAAPIIVQHVQDLLSKEQQRRHEFYEWVTEDIKAEFVNGEILVHSPVIKAHNDASMLLLMLLKPYVSKYDLGFVGIEKIMITLTRNDYEPDICFFSNPNAKKFHKTQLHFPTPDFVVEVLSKSSKKMMEHDTKTKFEDYQQHGVAEYWIIDPVEEVVEQFILKDGKYASQLKATKGTISSPTIKGFEIPIRAIFDEKLNRETLLQILLKGQ